MNIPIKYFLIRFRWQDLPIPKEILNLMKKGPGYHLVLKAKINNKWICIDPTWDLKLEKIGFNEENNESSCWYQLMYNISNYIDETFCTKITATNYIANCYIMAAQNTMDVSLCKKVSKVDMGGCYSNIAAKTINLNECLQIMPDNQGKDQCYLEFIKKDKNLSYCDKITNKKDLSFCYYRYAIYSNDTSVCDKISSSSSLMKEDCYKGNCVFLGDTNRIAECVKARTK